MSRSNPAKEELDLATRRRLQIMAATSEVICRQGVDGARLKDIADEAGVSLGMLQHYFRHREALIVETIKALLELTLATWRVVSSREPDPVRRLFALLRFQVAGWAPFHKRWSFWVEFWSAAGRHEALRAQAQDVYREWTEPFRETIEQGVAAGAFRPDSSPDALIVRLMCVSDGAAIRVLYDPETLDAEGMFALLVDLAATGLGIDPAVRDQALAELPRVISVHYPSEPPPTDGLDWTPILDTLRD
ncbi:TetR/AcrR family transcriptional regulator [Actinomadura sp. SCN-SB]|uniref:TetR/AcrR family transcriptional regulator n=1 Tax=Actinomadura sp. SCN-SB TaxID=3373092 RepID=UPI00375135DC